MEKYLSLSDLNVWVNRCSKFLSGVLGIEICENPKDIFISIDEYKIFIKIIVDVEEDLRPSAIFEIERSSNNLLEFTFNSN